MLNSRFESQRDNQRNRKGDYLEGFKNAGERAKDEKEFVKDFTYRIRKYNRALDYIEPRTSINDSWEIPLRTMSSMEILKLYYDYKDTQDESVVRNIFSRYGINVDKILKILDVR